MCQRCFCLQSKLTVMYPFLAIAHAEQSLLAYGLATLGSLPDVNIYIDAAHAGWLGWPDVRNLFDSLCFNPGIDLSTLEYVEPWSYCSNPQ